MDYAERVKRYFRIPDDATAEQMEAITKEGLDLAFQLVGNFIYQNRALIAQRIMRQLGSDDLESCKQIVELTLNTIGSTHTGLQEGSVMTDLRPDDEGLH